MDARLEELIELTAAPNWEDVGAESIDRAEWDRASAVAKVAREEVPGIPEPFFSPSGDGTIHIKWASPTQRLEAELDQGTFGWIVYVDGRPKYTESPNAADLIQALRAVFR